MVSALSASSFREFSSALRASRMPPFSDSSTRTSNHDSIERCRKWNEIAYTMPPGISAISANTAIKRSVSFEPKTRSFSLRRNSMS